MRMNEKIEILLGRKRISKTQLAHNVGITYRAFANYMNESRTPRGEILSRIAEQLDTTPEFLRDDEKDIELTIEERFIKRICANESDKAYAAHFLEQSRGLFAGNMLSEDDLEALMQCLIDIYHDARAGK